MASFGYPIALRIVESAPQDAGLDARGEVQESRSRNGEISGPGLRIQPSRANLGTHTGRCGPKTAPGPPTRPSWGQGKTLHRRRGVRPEATPRGASRAHHPARRQRRGPRSMVCIWIKVIKGWARTPCCAGPPKVFRSNVKDEIPISREKTRTLPRKKQRRRSIASSPIPQSPSAPPCDFGRGHSRIFAPRHICTEK